MGVIRIILGIVVGIALGLCIVAIGDMINHALWPPPAEVQVTNSEAIREYMETAPVTSLLGLPITWTLAAFAASFAAAKIAVRTWAGWVAGGVLFAATGLNLALIPHPLWMLIAAVLFVPAAAFFGARYAGAQPAAPKVL